MNWKDLQGQLSQPFDAKDIQWRPGKKSNDGKKAQALPYAEPRVYEDRLNELCPGDWECDFLPWGETRIICRVRAMKKVLGGTDELSSTKI
jgi:hypothetical protein